MGELLRSGRGRGWKEFVAIDASGDASALVVRLYADDFREAADMHIAGEGNLPRQRENKFNRTSGFKIGVDQKIKPAEADVPRLALPFNPSRNKRTVFPYLSIVAARLRLVRLLSQSLR